MPTVRLEGNEDAWLSVSNVRGGSMSPVRRLGVVNNGAEFPTHLFAQRAGGVFEIIKTSKSFGSP